MRDNVTLPLGSIAITDKIESGYGLISGIFGKAGGKSRNFVGTVKLLLCSRMDDAVSVHRILPMSSDERFGLLSINDGIAERDPSIGHCKRSVENFLSFLRDIKRLSKNMD